MAADASERGFTAWSKQVTSIGPFDIVAINSQPSFIMASVTIRNLSDEVHRAIRLRAAQHGRSTEAEIRELLTRSVQTEGRLLMGSELRRYAQGLGGVDLDVKRDAGLVEPASFD